MAVNHAKYISVPSVDVTVPVHSHDGPPNTRDGLHFKELLQFPMDFLELSYIYALISYRYPGKLWP